MTLSNESMNIGNDQEKVSNKFDEFVPLLRDADVKERFIDNIRTVYGHCGTVQAFGQANVMEWLDCSKSKATNIMNVLRQADIIEKVKGLGPGKYRFREL